MKMQGSAFYFGEESNAADAKLDAFFTWVKGIDKSLRWPIHLGQGDAAKAYPFMRTFYLQELDDLWCGVILSAKTTEFSHHIVPDGDTVQVVARTVGEDPPVEVNFFCFRKDNHKGLYSHYMGAYPFTLMLKELWGAYLKFVFMQRDSEQERDASERALTKGDTYKLYSMKKKCNHGPIYNDNDFKTLLKAFDEIAEFRVTCWEADSPDDEPMTGKIDSVRKSYRFKDCTTPTAKLIDWLTEMRDKCTKREIGKKPKFSGSVLGQLPSGAEKLVYFEANIDDHLDFDYDEIGSFDVNKLDENPCLAAMIKVVRKKNPFKV